MANQQTNQPANQQLKDQLDSYKSRISKSRRRKRIAYIAGLCLVAVAIVGLVLPAATLEFGKTYCGQEEHTHTDACVNRTVICALPDTSNGNGHVHVPSCYDEQGALACGKTAVAHMHLANCVNAQGTALVCGQEETVHMHTVGCIDPATNTLACDTEGLAHVHGVTCYSLGADGSYVLVCKEPSVGHVHTELCLDPNTGEVACGLEEAIELSHIHTDACYDEELICGMEEHVHNELCYDEITEAIMKKDEESSAAKEAAEEAEGVEPGVAEGDLTAEEIAEARDQGLLFENEDVIVTFSVPDKYADEIQLTVTETDDEVEFVEAVDATEEVNAEGEPVDDEAAQEGDNGEPVFFSEEGEEAEGENVDDTDEPSDAIDSATETLVAEPVDDEPAYKINLRIEATLDGKPVDDIADLGLMAKLQMKPRIIAPILAEVDLSNVAEEVKTELGAEITVLQQPENTFAASISEVIPEQVDQVVATSTREAAMTFSLLSDVVTMEVEPTANPSFTVQYYANIPTIQYSDDKTSPPIIDTKGGKLPTNNGTTESTGLAIKKLALAKQGNSYQVLRTNQLTKVYSEGAYKYSNRPGMKYFNKLRTKENYRPLEIWVLRAGKKSDSVNANDWIVYNKKHKSYNGSDNDNPWKFTNNDDSEATADAIYIPDNAVIRIVYEVTEQSFNSAVDFYDYDISNGMTYETAANAANNTSPQDTESYQANQDKAKEQIFAKTNAQGINSDSNYKSGTKLAFGNSNTGTGLSDLTVKGSKINAYNSKGYKGCSFGLVSGLDSNGNPQYANGIVAPDLFGSGSPNGKTKIDNTALTFNRVGDTYTLSSAQVGNKSVENLESFNNPSFGDYTTYDTIYTNNFWPMDYAPTYGADGHDLKFGGYDYFTKPYQKNTQGKVALELTDLRRYQGVSTSGFPPSDDGLDHNSYFGMHYTIDFEVDKEYEGPLEYLFFGDDDLWIFLDGKLVVDIGGVHSSVGEYTNLWDYLNNKNLYKTDAEKYGKHTLQVFYTERGGSGSTCYMNFTLPSVSFQATDQVTSDLKISKAVESSTDLSDEEYRFDLSLVTGGNQSDLFDYKIFEKGDSDSLVSSGRIGTDDTFYLKANQYIVIKNLPIGTTFTVKEIFSEDLEAAYVTTSTITSKPTEMFARDVSGTVIKDQTIVVDYLNTKIYELPATGGEGTYWYWIGGGALVILALLMLWRRQTLATAPASSFTKSEASVLALFGDTNFASPSGKPESVYNKGLSRAKIGDESTRKGGRY